MMLLRRRRRSRRWQLRRWAFCWLLAFAVAGLELRPLWIAVATGLAAVPVGDRVTAKLWELLRPDETDLYFLWPLDPASRILYIGISNDVERRYVEHADEEYWWAEGTPTVVETYRTRLAALAAERRAIRKHKPLYNTVHNMDNPYRIDWRAAERETAA